MDWLLAIVLGYFAGSIPFGLLLGYAAGKGDIRQIGSGSIGATNVLRTGNKALAAGTVVLDLCKGLLPVFLAAKFFPGTAGMAALAAVVGHCFPIWLGFKGGKGIATGAGVLLAIAWPIALASAAAWIAMFAATRISSVGGISAALAAPVAGFLLGYEMALPWLVAIAALILWQHRSNIGRLLRGEEPKVGSKS